MRTTLISSAAGCLAALALLAPALARADTVTDWNGDASTAIVVTAGQPPPSAVLSFAMVQGAVYDAVNAIDRGHRAVSRRSRRRTRRTQRTRRRRRRRTASSPALFPAQQAALQPLYDASLAAVADSPGREGGGIAAGERGSGGDARRPQGRRPLRPVHARVGTTPGV